MIIVLNGPLGIGKSTLAEALMERIEHCVMLDGDSLAAVNPPPADGLEHLHAAIELLVTHHRRFGYRHFVLDYLWRSAEDLADLRRRLTAIDAGADIRCFLLTLPADEHLRRIEMRQQARAIDEREFELRTVVEERAVLAKSSSLGEPFDVSAPLPELVERMLRHLAL
jgi:thymidylate kinase